MDAQQLINAGMAVISGLIGWLVKAVWDAVRDLRADLKQIERDLPHSYVRRDDFNGALADIKAMLNRIFDRLENKADKA